MNDNVRAKAIESFKHAREGSEAPPGPEMTLDEINAIIKKVRKAKKTDLSTEYTDKDADNIAFANGDGKELIREKAIKAIQEIREQSAKRPEITLDEINAEIEAVRNGEKG